MCLCITCFGNHHCFNSRSRLTFSAQTGLLSSFATFSSPPVLPLFLFIKLAISARHGNLFGVYAIHPRQGLAMADSVRKCDSYDTRVYRKSKWGSHWKDSMSIIRHYLFDYILLPVYKVQLKESMKTAHLKSFSEFQSECEAGRDEDGRMCCIMVDTNAA